MSVELLATAASRLSKVCRQEGDLKETLSKWVAKTLKPSFRLPQLTELVAVTGIGTVELLLGALTEPNLRKLAKGLDGHNTELASKNSTAISAHVIALATGRATPAPAPEKPRRRTRNARATLADPSMIRTIGNRAERQAVLKSLTASQLRSYINEENLRPAGVRPNARKDDLVRHILDELEPADSPLPRLLANSKYGVRVPSR
jgi:hypothetical protein